VLAQRLVRRVCESCAEKYTPSREELSLLGLSD
jgi:type II secretory ATPase GspE/PulE/Tfp pilus assembly ATPase PilB-like protein